MIACVEIIIMTSMDSHFSRLRIMQQEYELLPVSNDHNEAARNINWNKAYALHMYFTKILEGPLPWFPENAQDEYCKLHFMEYYVKHMLDAGPKDRGEETQIVLPRVAYLNVKFSLPYFPREAVGHLIKCILQEHGDRFNRMLGGFTMGEVESILKQAPWGAVWDLPENEQVAVDVLNTMLDLGKKLRDKSGTPPDSTWIKQVMGVNDPDLPEKDRTTAWKWVLKGARHGVRPS